MSTGRGNPETNWNVGWGAGPPEGGFPTSAGLGAGLAPPPAGDFYDSFINLRHGSLSVEQQSELMDVLETEGMNDIDSFLNLGGPGGNAGIQWG